MFAGRSLGKAFRPSHFAAESEPEEAENPVERQTRIRAYARRVRLRMPLFEEEMAEGSSSRSLGAMQSA